MHVRVHVHTNVQSTLSISVPSRCAAPLSGMRRGPRGGGGWCTSWVVDPWSVEQACGQGRRSRAMSRCRDKQTRRFLYIYFFFLKKKLFEETKKERKLAQDAGGGGRGEEGNKATGRGKGRVCAVLEMERGDVDSGPAAGMRFRLDVNGGHIRVLYRV